MPPPYGRRRLDLRPEHRLRRAATIGCTAPPRQPTPYAGAARFIRFRVREPPAADRPAGSTRSFGRRRSPSPCLHRRRARRAPGRGDRDDVRGRHARWPAVGRLPQRALSRGEAASSRREPVPGVTTRRSAARTSSGRRSPPISSRRSPCSPPASPTSSWSRSGSPASRSPSGSSASGTGGSTASSRSGPSSSGRCASRT